MSGFWRVPPPDRQWVPGYWTRVEGGWQWTPGFWQVSAQDEVAYLPEPPATDRVEAGPSVPAPSADSVYVPGCWVYRQTRYVWRPGYWLGHRGGWVWVPAHYLWTPGGYVFVEGYWDYPLRTRGLLFAPVYLDAGLVARADWFYRPRFVVYSDFLFSALFVRPDYGWSSASADAAMTRFTATIAGRTGKTPAGTAICAGCMSPGGPAKRRGRRGP